MAQFMNHKLRRAQQPRRVEPSGAGQPGPPTPANRAQRAPEPGPPTPASRTQRAPRARPTDPGKSNPAGPPSQAHRPRQAEYRNLTVLCLDAPLPRASSHDTRWRGRPLSPGPSRSSRARRRPWPKATSRPSRRVRTAVPDGGERFTARPAGGPDQAGSAQAPARPRKRRAGGAARRDDEDDLNAWVRKVVDALPPLTDEQRDLLALIFRRNQRP
jgi:hypothetical protein